MDRYNPHKTIYLIAESKEHGIYSWCEDDIDGDDFRYIHKSVVEQKDARIKELEDLCIWMSGCGYDFTQHQYWNKKKKLLTNPITGNE